METAEILISRFGPVLAAAVEPSTPSGPTAPKGPTASADPADPTDPAAQAETVVLHAEVLHQLCTADGLLELLDWSRQGLGADPLACMWLGSLRWYRLITGSYPENAPQPPARRLDAQLQRLSSRGRLTVQQGSGTTSLRGLSQGQMSYPSAPAQPESTDAAALLRAVPVGLAPYIDATMRRAWARQTLALTHGHPDLSQKAEDLADLVNLLASGAPSDALPEAALAQKEKITAGLDDDVAAILDRQLRAAAGAAPAPLPAYSRLLQADSERESQHVYGVIGALAQDWEEVTRAR
ncbi:ADP-ribosylglycohydrolase family protein [Nesterenkonia sp. CF4.4]|uniref:ADP-ribosylglycohydrolase family protein n=1 Tax=Nesterenkonia sp. CF4.4 TaxID=3373079 RepID=UPI003EE7CF7B